jgi:hypothetical protein
MANSGLKWLAKLWLVTVTGLRGFNMKEMLENLSVALGYKGEINKDTQETADNMLAFGMNYIEINAYALSWIELENFGKY